MLYAKSKLDNLNLKVDLTDTNSKIATLTEKINLSPQFSSEISEKVLEGIQQKTTFQDKAIQNFSTEIKGLKAKIKTLEKDLVKAEEKIDQACTLKILYESLIAINALKVEKPANATKKIAELAGVFAKINDPSVISAKVNEDLIELTDLLAKDKNPEKLYSGIEKKIRKQIEKIKLP
jgi:hypothetical protein